MEGDEGRPLVVHAAMLDLAERPEARLVSAPAAQVQREEVDDALGGAYRDRADPLVEVRAPACTGRPHGDEVAWKVHGRFVEGSAST